MQETEPRVAPEIVDQAISSLDKYILDHYGKPTRRTLRGRQITVVEDLRDTLRGGQTEGYVTIPTGVGKTVLFTEVTEALNEQEILETMIVVPTKILVDQTAERFHQFAPDLQVGKLYSDAHDITQPVTITTYASLVRHIEDGTLDANLYKLLVLDEVHRSLSGKRSQAVAQFTNAIKLGFTATPMYSEDRNVANLLNTEIHKMTIREAVEEDLLSPFSAIIAETDIDLSNISIKSSGDYDDQELEEAINISSRNQAAIDLYNKLFQSQTAVAYCTSVKHAQDLAKLFTENGILAGFVSGYQGKNEQADVLKRYHNGEVKVLCNADLLIEGFDEPKASVCLNLRPTKSIVLAQQRAGRVLRLDPDNPNKHAVIVDFLDKTEDPRKLSVTFAEVAEAAYITTKKAGGSNVVAPKVPGGIEVDIPVDTGTGINFFDEDNIEISGLKITVNPQEVMRIVKEMNEKQYQPAPEGWLTMNEIGKKFSIAPFTVVKLATQLKDGDVTNLTAIFISKNGNVYTYFSPELIKNIKGKLEKATSTNGWMDIPDFAKLLGITNQTALRLVQRYEESDPKQVRNFRNTKNGQQTRFISLDTAKKIKEERGKNIPIAQKGWMSLGGIAGKLHMAMSTVEQISNKYRDAHPEYFQLQIIKSNGNIVEHFSPELVAFIEKEKQISMPPEGWLDYNSLATELGYKNHSRARDAVKSYRTTHPNYFKTYTRLGEVGKAATFLHPELITLIKQERGTFPKN